MYEAMSSQVEHRDVHNVRIQVDVVTERQEHPILAMLGELLTAAPDRSLTRFMVSIITWWKAHNIRESEWTCHLGSISFGGTQLRRQWKGSWPELQMWAAERGDLTLLGVGLGSSLAVRQSG